MHHRVWTFGQASAICAFTLVGAELALSRRYEIGMQEDLCVALEGS
jgi:hypothetical protein